MAISDGTLSAADIAAVTGSNGFGGFGNDGGWWLILLFLFAFGGWGNNGWGNGNNGGAPYIVNDVQRGFDQSAVMGGISGIQTSLSNGFANAEVSRCNGLANITNQLTNMASNQATCCCENRLAIANLSADLAREACADRSAVSDALRDVLEANNASTQRILDQMCADKIDAKNEQIAALQQQLTMSQLAASQNAQTAAIIANNEAQTSALERYLAPVPIPAYIVQNPNGCGCGISYGSCGGYVA